MPESVIWVSAESASLPFPLARGRRHRAIAGGRLSNLATGVVLCGTAAVLLHFGGLDELIQGTPALAVIAGATAALIRTGREHVVRRPTTGSPPREATTAVRWKRPAGAAQGD